MKRLLIALTVATMLLPAMAWSMSSTLNNDFEGGFQANGIANGWSAFNGVTPVCAGDSINHHSGAWSQKVVSGGVKAKFAAPPGLCKVSVWVKAPAGAARVAVTGNEQDSGKLNASDYMANTVSNTWQQLTKTVVAKIDGVVVFCAAYGGTVYFDEVTVEPVGAHNPPAVIWWNDVNPGGIGGNPFLCGGVFGGNVIFGQMSNCAKMYGDAYVNDTPLVHQTPSDEGNDDYTSKGATILSANGHTYIYCSTGYGDIRQSVDWGPLGHYIPFNKANTVVPATDPLNALLRKKATNDSATLVTDGTYIYAHDATGSTNAATNTIYKWQMNNANEGTIVGNVAPFPVTISGCSKLLGICYWNGKIYAAEAYDGGNIYEIDCTTGAVTTLPLDTPVPNTGGIYGQVVRYGDKIFVGTTLGHLYTWQLKSGIWKLVSGYDLRMNEKDPSGWPDFTANPGYVLGLAVKGDGVRATNAWVNTGGICRYYDLYPYPPTPSDLGKVDFDSDNPAWVSDAVVTALGPGTGFWIESQERTRGAWVPTTQVPAVGSLVTVKGLPSKSASGEKTLTPLEPVGVGALADPALRPLMITNKNMGPATGSAGLATDGMLVTITGKLTGLVDTDNYAFYIDDGSGVPSGIASPSTGVKVTIANGDPDYMVDNVVDFYYSNIPCTVTATGIVRLDLVGGNVVRRIDALSAADVVVTAL